MRFKQYLTEIAPDQLNDEQLDKLTHEAGIKDYIKCPDGRIDVTAATSSLIILSKGSVCKDGRSLLNIRRALCDVPIDMSGDLNQVKLSEWDNIPKVCMGGLTIGHSHFKNADIKYLPKLTSLLAIYSTELTSLRGIEHVKFTNDHNGVLGTLEIDPRQIKEGGIGLLLCEGLHNLVLTDADGFYDDVHEKHNKDHNKRSVQAFLIIEKYIGKSNQFFDCQAELIEEGYEEFVKL